MSSTQFVKYKGDGFWAFDVSLGILLKYVVDVAEPLAAGQNFGWLAEAAAWWRVIAIVSDYGLEIDRSWSSEQINVFVSLVQEARGRLAQRKCIPAEEMEGWDVLDGEGIDSRGSAEFPTAPVIELGDALISLVKGTLPPAPTGAWWFYGPRQGRDILWMGLNNATELNVWFDTDLDARRISDLYARQGWFCRDASPDAEIKCEIAHLRIVAEDGLVVIFGKVSNIETNIKRVVQPLQEAGIACEAESLDDQKQPISRWSWHPHSP